MDERQIERPKTLGDALKSSDRYPTRRDSIPSNMRDRRDNPNVRERVVPLNSQDADMDAALQHEIDEDALNEVLKQGRERLGLEGLTETPPASKGPRDFNSNYDNPTQEDLAERQKRFEEIKAQKLSERTNATNQSADEHLPPPPITPGQLNAKLLRDKSESKLETLQPVANNAKPRFVVNQIDRNAKFFRLELLSGFVFYKWKDAQARRIALSDQVKIHVAQQTRDLSAFIDAVGATLADNIDIRDFTIPDFFYFLYWHRLRSYTTTPFNITWTSKYGNENRYRITEADIKYNPPKITEEEYAEWQAKGFTIPTVRDMEVFVREELNAEERWIFDRAQYFYGVNEDGVPNIEAKIQAFNNACLDSLDALGELENFKAATDHSVEETIQLTDAKFNAETYVQALEQQIKYLEQQAELASENEPIRFMSLQTEAEERKEELDSLKKQLENGGKVLPDIEDVVLNLHPLDFFPNI